MVTAAAAGVVVGGEATRAVALTGIFFVALSSGSLSELDEDDDEELPEEDEDDDDDEDDEDDDEDDEDDDDDEDEDPEEDDLDELRFDDVGFLVATVALVAGVDKDVVVADADAVALTAVVVDDVVTDDVSEEILPTAELRALDDNEADEILDGVSDDAAEAAVPIDDDFW